MNRAMAAVGVLASALAAAWALHASTTTTRRPEGAAERFLHAVSIDEPDETDDWADLALVANLTAFDPDDDTRFATIEVGAATNLGATATVPARVVRNDHKDTEVHLQLTATHDGGDPGRWRITGVEHVDRAPVPSGGGGRPARADRTVWLALAVTALAAAVAADLLVTRLRQRGGPT